MPERKHIVIIGGGVAGLATAWRLLADPELGERTPTKEADPSLAAADLKELRRDLEVTVVEAAPRWGGNIRSEREDGYIVEWGPNGFLDNAPETPRLIRLMGIENRVVPAYDAAGTRFLFVRGRLQALPTSPPAFFSSPILSLPGRLRVLKEPFVPGRADPRESVYSFAARRIGPEAASILVDAMVSGVYGGDSRQLSLVSAFPKMHAMEKGHGSLVKAMFARRKEAKREREAAASASDGSASTGSASAATNASGDGASRKKAQAGPAGPGGILTSFDNGMEVLIECLVEALENRPDCRLIGNDGAVRVTRVAGSDADTGTWTVELRSGETLRADGVVLALPSREAAPLVAHMDGALSAVLQEIPDAPLIVVGLAFRPSAFPRPVEGFGFLVPRKQGPRSLGVLWDSSIYPNRAPEGFVLVRAMIGGAQDRAAIEMSDSEVLRTVAEDLSRTMGAQAGPARTWIFRHPHGIPQYTLGHPDRLEAIAAAEARHPGLRFSGNSYKGISVNHCIEESIPVARTLLASTRALTARRA